MNQMRGGFSKELKRLRDEMLTFTSLIELELDFGEEGGDAFRLAPPGYALHRLLDSGEWATHFGAMPIPDTFAGPYRFKGVVNPHED